MTPRTRDGREELSVVLRGVLRELAEVQGAEDRLEQCLSESAKAQAAERDARQVLEAATSDLSYAMARCAEELQAEERL